MLWDVAAEYVHANFQVFIARTIQQKEEMEAKCHYSYVMWSYLQNIPKPPWKLLEPIKHFFQNCRIQKSTDKYQ